MPLKISVGLSKKIGQPDYGSLGASCHVEFEADHHLLQTDPDGFHRQVASAFVACQQAVQEELQRHTRASTASSSVRTNGRPDASTNGHAPSPPRKATSSQIRAINAIAQRVDLDLHRWLLEKYGLRAVAQLSVPQASATIDALKEMPAPETGGTRS